MVVKVWESQGIYVFGWSDALNIMRQDINEKCLGRFYRCLISVEPQFSDTIELSVVLVVTAA